MVTPTTNSPPPRASHVVKGYDLQPKEKRLWKGRPFAHLHRTHHSSDRAMDSEHESEDEFNTNNDDTRTEDGSDRGEPEEGV